MQVITSAMVVVSSCERGSYPQGTARRRKLCQALSEGRAGSASKACDATSQVVLLRWPGGERERRDEVAAFDPAPRQRRPGKSDALALHGGFECQAQIDQLGAAGRFGPVQPGGAEPGRPGFDRRAQQDMVAQVAWLPQRRALREQRWRRERQHDVVHQHRTGIGGHAMAHVDIGVDGLQVEIGDRQHDFEFDAGMRLRKVVEVWHEDLAP
jgi:hypothetical protein